MATNFPSSLDSLTNPTASDKLNSVTVPHATQHADLNDAVEALEAKVGVDGSAVTSSHDYILTNGVLPTLNVDSGVLVVDDTNDRVGVNDATPSYALDVTGDINATGDLRIGGTAVGVATAFTPSWNNLTPGNATETWYYTQVNDLVYVYGDTTFGSTTSIGGTVSMTVPVGTISSGATLAGTPNGRARCTDSNAGPLFVMTAVQVSTATAVTFCPETIGATFVQRGGVLSATYPFTWATGDRINASFVYQIA